MVEWLLGTRLGRTLLAGAGALLLIGIFYGMYRWEKHERQIVQTKLDAIFLGQEVIIGAQKTTRDYQAKAQAIDQRGKNEHQTNRDAAGSGNLDRIIDRYQSYGVRIDKGSPPPGR